MATTASRALSTLRGAVQASTPPPRAPLALPSARTAPLEPTAAPRTTLPCPAQRATGAALVQRSPHLAGLTPTILSQAGRLQTRAWHVPRVPSAAWKELPIIERTCAHRDTIAPMQKHARQARAPQAPTSGSPAPPHLRSVYLAQKALPARRQLLGPSPARTAPTARLAQDLPRNAARARTVPRLPESPASARLPSTSPNVQLTSTHTARMAPTALKVPALRRLAQQDTSERARGRTWTTSRAAPAATQASLQWRVRTLARPAQRATCASARQPPPQEEGGASNERGSSAPPAPSTRARATGALADSTALLGPRLSAPARREPISQLQASLRWPPASLAQLVRSAVTSARQLAGPA